MVNPIKPPSIQALNTGMQNIESQEKVDGSSELMKEISLNFTTLEYKSVKECIDAFINPDNPLKATDFNAVNQSIFFEYGIDDDTFIPRLQKCGLVDISNGSVRGNKLTQETFVGVLAKLQN